MRRVFELLIVAVALAAALVLLANQRAAAGLAVATTGVLVVLLLRQQRARPPVPRVPPPDVDATAPDVLPASTDAPKAAPLQPPAPAPAPRDRTVPPGVPVPVPPVLPTSEATAAPALDPDEPASFSAYTPREVRPQVWVPLLAYAYRQSARDMVRRDADVQMGDQDTLFRLVEARDALPIAVGAPLTATPSLGGFAFNPPALTLGFFEPWHRFAFKMRADALPTGQAANGHLDFSVEGVVVARVPLSVYVDSAATDATPTAGTGLYQAVFCSYSREDKHIVEKVERAYRALGLHYLRDVASLRSGEVWGEAIARLIEQADVFQLFWSRSASESAYVREEIRYALGLTRGPGFIRPVYWQQPIPLVPPELRHIHFAYEPLLAVDAPPLRAVPPAAPPPPIPPPSHQPGVS